MLGKELVLIAQTEGREILAPTCFRAESKGNSLQNIVVTNKQAKLNTNGKEEDPPSDEYPPSDDEYLSEDCRPTGMEIDSVKGTEIPISLLSSREPTSTPPKSTVDKFGDTIKRHVISDTNSNARSDCSIGQPRQEEVSSSTVPKGEFSTPKNATSSGFSDSDGDESVGNNDTTYNTLPTRKRKHLTPAHTVGRKRHSQKPNTTLKQYPERAVSSIRRQKPSPVHGRAFANRPLAIKPTPRARVSICGTKIHSNNSSNKDSKENSSDSISKEELSKPQNNEHAPLCSESKVASPIEPGEDDEYKVEQILDARVYYRRLQYRVK
ncbi:hypothetical protein K491DRAFT_685475 [Lophiostoma macrostomum CBS 122681]|uniref:Uncharacterized protein n=1 Tax=Lophiostoma macrostomum CBS 122681 TaxID=1314788 RepID=A0A6A6SIA4_9PLEO|nr:hypothetical protein K491DRAFT_685475 [Lophiostoma macrostomum CBS 122681]